MLPFLFLVAVIYLLLLSYLFAAIIVAGYSCLIRLIRLFLWLMLLLLLLTTSANYLRYYYYYHAATATTTNSNAALAVQVTISGFASSGSSGDFCGFCGSGITSALLLQSNAIRINQNQSELIGFILINRISSDKHLCPTIHYNTLRYSLIHLGGAPCGTFASFLRE